jgi:lysophospholipase L1-like esterase
MIRAILSFGLVLAVGGCAAGTAAPSLRASSTAGSPSAASQPGATAALPSTVPLRLVVLGDSVAAGGEGPDGLSFGESLAVEVEKLAGRPVELLLRADPPETSASLLEKIRTNARLRGELAGADLITVSVGGNDSDPFAAYPQGTCAVGGEPEACLAAYAPSLEPNLSAILSELVALRAGEPTAIRLTTDYNPLIGLEPSDDLPSFAPDLGLTFYRQVEDAESAAVCRVAARAGAKCVDTYRAHNGADGSQDAAAFLAEDHLHLSAAGRARITALMLEAGFDPLVFGGN